VNAEYNNDTVKKNNIQFVDLKKNFSFVGLVFFV